MNTRQFFRPFTAMIIGGATLLGGLQARADDVLPIYESNGVEFMSGGVGSDESRLMKSLAPSWPAMFEFATRNGNHSAYAADVVVTVRDANRQEVLSQVPTDGPFLLAQLRPGRYTVDATLDGRTIRRDVQVRGGGTTRALFLFPAGTDVDKSL